MLALLQYLVTELKLYVISDPAYWYNSHEAEVKIQCTEICYHFLKNKNNNFWTPYEQAKKVARTFSFSRGYSRNSNTRLLNFAIKYLQKNNKRLRNRSTLFI